LTAERRRTIHSQLLELVKKGEQVRIRIGKRGLWLEENGTLATLGELSGSAISPSLR
jgi:hypothetical protein